MHGGVSTGAPKGNRNAWKHGLYSRETKELRQLVKELAATDVDEQTDDKEITTAGLFRAMKQESENGNAEELQRLVNTLVDRAVDGDVSAIKIVADAVDGPSG